MKETNFHGDITSIPIDDLEDHDVLVLDLTSMRDATENYHYQKIIGEPLWPEVNSTCPLEHSTELFVLGERISSYAVDNFGVVGKNI